VNVALPFVQQAFSSSGSQTIHHHVLQQAYKADQIFWAAVFSCFASFVELPLMVTSALMVWMLPGHMAVEHGRPILQQLAAAARCLTSAPGVKHQQ
jgi:hypothetical protein